MAENKYSFYRKGKDGKVLWLDNYDVVGEYVFSFDKKKLYNLFRDYPHKLSAREWMLFNAENEYWKEFFADRNAEYEQKHAKEIAELLGNK